MLGQKIIRVLSLLLLILFVSLTFPHKTFGADNDPPKKIVVSLSNQTLTAYNGDQVFLQTSITTGGIKTPTPSGSFSIQAKKRNFVMRSPWPKNDWRWYPNSFVRYGLLYQAGGYYIHDASWRSNFGVGSNTASGTPGGNYTGTHGCINVPLGAEVKLYSWSEIGTPVYIQ